MTIIIINQQPHRHFQVDDDEAEKRGRRMLPDEIA